MNSNIWVYASNEVHVICWIIEVLGQSKFKPSRLHCIAVCTMKCVFSSLHFNLFSTGLTRVRMHPKACSGYICQALFYLRREEAWNGKKSIITGYHFFWVYDKKPDTYCMHFTGIQWNFNYLNFDYPNTWLFEHFTSALAHMHTWTSISKLNHPNSQLSERFCLVPASLDNPCCTIFTYRRSGDFHPFNLYALTLYMYVKFRQLTHQRNSTRIKHFVC